MPLALVRGSTASNPKHEETMSRAYVLLDQGAKYGKWEVIGSRVVIKNSRHYPCRCECGTEKIVHASSLASGKTVSCGCYNSQVTSERNFKHGATSRDEWTPEYTAWKNLKGRVGNPKTPLFHRYGGRGIEVCSGWKGSFSSFLADIGERPTPESSVDRIDNNGHYSCGHCSQCLSNGWIANCRWATRIEQGRNRGNNRHLERDGEVLVLAEWCEKLGKPFWQVLKLLREGYFKEVKIT